MNQTTSTSINYTSKQNKGFERTHQRKRFDSTVTRVQETQKTEVEKIQLSKDLC